MLFWVMESYMGLMTVVVPLDRVLLNFYRMSMETILLPVMVCLQFAMQILTGGSDPQISPSCGGTRAPV